MFNRVRERPRDSLWRQLIMAVFTFALPAIGMFVIAMAQVMLLAFIAMYSGVPPVLRSTADIWTKRALGEGFPMEWDHILWHVMYTVGVIVVIIGSIVNAWLTLFIVRLIIF